MLQPRVLQRGPLPERDLPVELRLRTWASYGQSQNGLARSYNPRLGPTPRIPAGSENVRPALHQDPRTGARRSRLHGATEPRHARAIASGYPRVVSLAMTFTFDRPRNRVSRLISLSPALLFAVGLGCSSSSDKGSTGGSSNDAAITGPEPTIPPVPDVCPTLAPGDAQTVSVLGKDVLMWIGEKQADKKGPILFYWHGTGSVAAEIEGFMAPQIAEVTAQGGVVASFTTTIGTGTTTGNLVWYTGDYDLADVILACAVQQLNIDTRRIYAAGCSAGGLQSGSMVLARSSYLAGAMPNSGGDILVSQWEDPNHVPSVMTAHGTYDNDFVILHFSEWSLKLDQAVADKGGYAVDCTHPYGHCMIVTDPKATDVSEVIAPQWQFLKDHPYGITTDPYANGLPSSFPSYCTKVGPTADQ